MYHLEIPKLIITAISLYLARIHILNINVVITQEVMIVII